MKEIHDVLTAAGWLLRAPEAVTAAVTWTKALANPDDDVRVLEAVVEPAKGWHGVNSRRVTVSGTRYDGGDRSLAHVRVTLTEDCHVAEVVSTVAWFESEVTAALALLGRGVHE